jgi:hypothetical protein
VLARLLIDRGAEKERLGHDVPHQRLEVSKQQARQRINTAIRWVRYVGRDWADYLAARAAEQDKKSGEARE